MPLRHHRLLAKMQATTDTYIVANEILTEFMLIHTHKTIPFRVRPVVALQCIYMAVTIQIIKQFCNN